MNSPLPAEQNLPSKAQPAFALIQGLVEIPSLSGQEAAASNWLVGQMQALGFARAYVDAAGNAVGELGEPNASTTVVLLGHIDTVPGDIPVRVEAGDAGPVLYGRGSVDAKGPLAAFVWAAARVGHAWCVAHDVQLVVVGAVEEEAATSKGARLIRDRFNGTDAPRPAACIIGEPSGWNRVTLGYKGRILLEAEARQPMAHTAGPDAGVATVPVGVWNYIAAYCSEYNAARPKAFDQLLPSLRTFRTWTDDAMHDRAQAQMGMRLPEDFPVAEFVQDLATWAASTFELEAEDSRQLTADATGYTGPVQHTLSLAGPKLALKLHLRGYEPAWRSDRQNPLVRSFLGAIRSVDPGAKPGFVVKTGTSDMNVVAPAWQCPILAYGPGDSALDHTPHEHLHLWEFWQSTLVLEQALRTLTAG
ncbi:MAG: M20/M25/M40 family metallo-hydrolase [Litorilinea sp.]